MREQAAGRSADKGPDPGQNGVPRIRIERAVVNAADQLEQGFVQVHVQAPPGIRSKLETAMLSVFYYLIS
jgi:hypothetical protein